MAKQYHTQDRPAPANETKYNAPTTGNIPDRFLKVANITEYARADKTAIRLCGVWLKQAGFLAHTPVRVRVMPGCLVITSEG